LAVKTAETMWIFAAIWRKVATCLPSNVAHLVSPAVGRIQNKTTGGVMSKTVLPFPQASKHLVDEGRRNMAGQRSGIFMSNM
jgi:hypothetical protein